MPRPKSTSIRYSKGKAYLVTYHHSSSCPCDRGASHTRCTCDVEIEREEVVESQWKVRARVTGGGITSVTETKAPQTPA